VFLDFNIGSTKSHIKWCIHKGREPKTYIGRQWKQCQMPNWTPPLWLACRDDRNGYIICLLWSSNERDMHKTSCGLGGTLLIFLNLITSYSPSVSVRSTLVYRRVRKNTQAHGNTPATLHLRSMPKGIESKERCVLPSILVEQFIKQNSTACLVLTEEYNFNLTAMLNLKESMNVWGIVYIQTRACEHG
jgi:hypothetical protein